MLEVVPGTVQVTNILRANEENWDFPAGVNAVRSSDHNQLASNSPIEDTKNEAYFKSRNGKAILRHYQKKKTYSL